MGFKTPFICEIAPDTFAINEYGLDAMYLLIGEDEALLIDTGCGLCDLPAVVKSLTDKPFRVAATHGHMDHIGGMNAFSEVYLNERDIALARSIRYEDVYGYADTFGKAGSYQIYDYSPDSLPKEWKFPRFLPLAEGMVFSLGNREIEVYEIAGHTPGGCVFLDRKNRLMISGDCCNVNLLASDSSVSETLAALKKFKSLTPYFDQNFNGHVGYIGMPSCFSQPKSVPDDLIHICELVLDGKGTPEPYEFLGCTFSRMRYGNAQMSYNPLWLTGGKPQNC